MSVLSNNSACYPDPVFIYLLTYTIISNISRSIVVLLNRNLLYIIVQINKLYIYD